MQSFIKIVVLVSEKNVHKTQRDIHIIKISSFLGIQIEHLFSALKILWIKLLIVSHPYIFIWAYIFIQFQKICIPTYMLIQDPKILVLISWISASKNF